MPVLASFTPEMASPVFTSLVLTSFHVPIRSSTCTTTVIRHIPFVCYRRLFSLGNRKDTALGHKVPPPLNWLLRGLTLSRSSQEQEIARPLDKRYNIRNDK